MKRAIIAAFVFAACDPYAPAGVPADPSPPPPGPPKFATFLDLHAGVIARTCSPNPGVCHARDNQPDLSTASTTLLAISAPCNLAPPDPTQGFDACERRGDHLVTGGFESELGFIAQIETGVFEAGLRDRPTESGRFDFHIERDGATVVALDDLAIGLGIRLAIELVKGSTTATMGIYWDRDQQVARVLHGNILDGVIPGDANRNGVFGADREDRVHVIEPGHVDRSYLWGRITGTMPGTRMPLANQPLSAEEYVAIACWIEGLEKTSTPSVEDRIDYEGCAFAKNPIDYSKR